MGIRVDHGPSPGAVGAVAYAGARGQEERRRAEVNARLRLQQQQMMSQIKARRDAMAQQQQQQGIANQFRAAQLGQQQQMNQARMAQIAGRRDRNQVGAVRQNAAGGIDPVIQQQLMANAGIPQVDPQRQRLVGNIRKNRQRSVQRNQDDKMLMAEAGNLDIPDLERPAFMASRRDALEQQRMAEEERLQQEALQARMPIDQDQLEMQWAGVEDLEGMVDDKREKLIQEENYTPEGKAKADQLRSQLEKIIAAKDVSISPKQYRQALAKWNDLHEQAKLDSFVKPPPTPQEEISQNSIPYTGPDGSEVPGIFYRKKPGRNGEPGTWELDRTVFDAQMKEREIALKELEFQTKSTRDPSSPTVNAPKDLGQYINQMDDDSYNKFVDRHIKNAQRDWLSKNPMISTPEGQKPANPDTYMPTNDEIRESMMREWERDRFLGRGNVSPDSEFKGGPEQQSQYQPDQWDQSDGWMDYELPPEDQQQDQGMPPQMNEQSPDSGQQPIDFSNPEPSMTASERAADMSFVPLEEMNPEQNQWDSLPPEEKEFLVRQQILDSSKQYQGTEDWQKLDSKLKEEKSGRVEDYIVALAPWFAQNGYEDPIGAALSAASNSKANENALNIVQMPIEKRRLIPVFESHIKAAKSGALVYATPDGTVHKGHAPEHRRKVAGNDKNIEALRQGKFQIEGTNRNKGL